MVRNRGRVSSRALLTAELRLKGKPVFVLGAANTKRITGKRRFTIHAVGPVSLTSGRYALVACASPKRGAARSCRRLKGTVVVVARSAPTLTPGARSSGDRLFPGIGNGGYDARHYDLTLAYNSDTKLLQGTAAIDATALKNLSEYSLDLYGMPVSSVLVDGNQAAFKQEPGKLIVTPAAGIPLGASFTTTVTYASPVVAYTDPDGSEEGWVPTSDGAFVVNEPVGAMSWFPNDNVPTDKATYDLHVTVAGSREVLGSGNLVSNTPNADGTRTWHWREASPMASYLVTATNGEFDFTQDSNTYYGLDSSYNAAQKSR